MKSLKKILSIFAAFMMVVGLTMTSASAEGNGSITIDNPIKGETYKAYKIFTTTYNTDKTSYAYTINSDDPWYNDVKEYANENGTGLKLTATTNDKEYKVTIDEDTFNPSKFSAFLKTKLVGKSGKEFTVDKEDPSKLSVTGLDLGYYFVSSTNGALCNLTTTNPSVNIQDKNDVPFKKELDPDQTQNVQIGDTVKYVITAKIPVTDGFDEYTYIMSDKMSDGLTFNFSSIEVYVDNNLITTGYTATETSNGFNLSFDMKALQDHKLKTLTVKYTATVNENAKADVETNEAKLQYTNGPDNSTTTTPSKTVEVYTAKVVINKTINNADGAPLAGAGFVLINNNENDENYGKYYHLSEDGKVVTWVSDIEEASEYVTIIKDGKAEVEFVGLKTGSYKIHEKTTPDGYNTLTDDKEITITEATNNNGNINSASLIFNQNISNTTGTQLPSTGGMGTTMIYIAGAILMVGAAIIFVTNKRMKHE